MNVKNRFTMPTAAICIALALSACGSRAGEEDTAAAESCVDTSGDTIKAGAVNSLSGATAVNETVIRDAIVMATEEINASGGVLGKQIDLVTADGASDPATYAEKAQQLVAQDCVAAVFGGYTSASRKAMLPIFESTDSLLFYGQQYEGLEASENIFYTGATTNQQIIPALDYLKEQGIKTLYLVGSDYVFPRTTNSIVKAYAEANGMEVVGEDYVPLGGTDFSTIANKMKGSDADAVFNTVVGDSLVAFFNAYSSVGLDADSMPVMSMCVGEEEVKSIGPANLVGQLAAWDYFQSLDTPENQTFVAAFNGKYGADRVTSDPMEAAYTGVYLWKALVEKAQSFDTSDIQAAADGTTVISPEGTVTVDGDNNHVTKTARIGKSNADGQFDIVWESDGPIDPDPFLETYEWAGSVQGG